MSFLLAGAIESIYYLDTKFTLIYYSFFWKASPIFDIEALGLPNQTSIGIDIENRIFYIFNYRRAKRIG